VVLKPGVKAALIMGNMQPAGLQVQNGIGPRAQIGLNETPLELAPEIAAHYRLKIGTTGDEEYTLSGWHGQEPSPDSPKESGSQSARWTSGNARLQLPVKPGTAYTLKLWASVPKGAPPQTVAMTEGPKVTLGEGAQMITLQIPAQEKKTIEVTISGETWQPAKLQPPLTDKRELGARVYAVELIAAGAENIPVTDVN
jgi:hypothetical protein